MRALIWSNAFTRSFKRWMRKRPDLDNDIAEALRLLTVDPFVLQLETTSLRENFQGHGRAARDTIFVYPVGSENRTGAPAVPSFYFFQSTIVNRQSSIVCVPYS